MATKHEFKIEIEQIGSTQTVVQLLDNQGEVVKENSVPLANGFQHTLGVFRTLTKWNGELAEQGKSASGMKRALKTWNKRVDSYAR